MMAMFQMLLEQQLMVSRTNHWPNPNPPAAGAGAATAGYLTELCV